MWSTITRRRLLRTAAGGLSASLGATGCLADLAAPALGSDLGELVRLAGQTLMVGFVGSRPGDGGTRALSEQLATGEVGGVILVGRNIESLRQTSELTAHLQDVASGGSILVAVDNEGGAVTRTANKAGFSDWMAAEAVPAALGTAESARTYYRQRAGELRRAGINLNLAPVVDVNVNPANAVIGGLGRSFSSDPGHVAAFAWACVQGHRDAAVLTCLKHFPGHGSSSADTHDGIADVTGSWAAVELDPYVALIGTNGVDSLMLSHVVHAGFTGDSRTPVSLSSRAVAYVRSGLRFDGPVVTDDLHMGAILQEHTDEDAAVLALAAGSDVLILSNYEMQDPDLGSRVNAAIVRAVIDRRLDAQRLVKAAGRVGALKARMQELRVL